jgi:ribosomal-protein-alanine N-acetyltransferase
VERTTERLHLREFVEGDAESLHVCNSDPEVVRWTTHGVMTLDQTREYLAKSIAAARETPRNVVDLAVTRRDGGAFVGRVGFRLTGGEPREAMLWYVLRRADWGQGLSCEAARALLDHAFRELHLHRVYVDIDPENLASIRVAEKLGMRHEAHHKSNTFIKGQWVDTVILAILDDEWR